MIWIWLIVAAVISVALYFYFRPRRSVSTGTVPDRVSVASTGGTGKVDYGDSPYPGEDKEPLIVIKPPSQKELEQKIKKDLEQKIIDKDGIVGLSSYFQ